MRKVREVLRLRWGQQLGERETALSCHLGKGTVQNYIKRARAAGLKWPLPEPLSDAELEARLFPVLRAQFRADRPEPDWEALNLQLKRKGVTLELLWREYLEANPNGYSYSAFTLKYRQWRKAHTSVTLRQEHKAGEKLFVDYAGLTVPLMDRSSGEISQGQVFVAVLGASNYTYCEVTASQSLPDWLSSHRRAFEFLGGVPEIVVPDNLKSGVKSPSYYEPELNPAYAELAQHYAVAVIPARVRKPRDKAKVETGVQIVEREILAPLRDRTFFGVREANEAIFPLLERLNARPFQKLEGSRISVFQAIEQEVLRPLPLEPYVPSSWKKAKVGPDYHIDIERHYDSVPYRHVGKTVEVRLTQATIEVFLEGDRIAVHARKPDLSRYRGKHTTLKDHMPEKHQKHLDWTPERLTAWASKIGEYTVKLLEKVMQSKDHPQQGFRACLGILRLGERYGDDRLERACKRAFVLRGYNSYTVKSILERGLENQPLEDAAIAPPSSAAPHHRFVRGSSYYADPVEPPAPSPTPPLKS